MQQFAITNGLYLIDATGNNVYYYGFMLIKLHMLFKYFYIQYLVLCLLVIHNRLIGQDIQHIQQIEPLIYIYQLILIIIQVLLSGNIHLHQPSVEKYVKLTKGSYSSMVITLTDQNNNTIYLNDPNILLTLLFRKKLLISPSSK